MNTLDEKKAPHPWLKMMLFLILPMLFASCDYLLPKEDYKPSGQQFSLNSEIELIGIRSSDTLYSPSATFTLELRIKLKNGTNEKGDTLNSGLFFLSSDKDKKDMIIVKNLPITAYSNERVYIIPAFGVQRRRGNPSATDYNLGPLTDDSDLRQITEILKKKRIAGQDVALVQSAIYRITDGEELTPGLLDTLRALPDEDSHISKASYRLLPANTQLLFINFPFPFFLYSNESMYIPLCKLLPCSSLPSQRSCIFLSDLPL